MPGQEQSNSVVNGTVCLNAGAGGRNAWNTGWAAVRSAFNAAVLSLVIERPSYGYELFQRFEERFSGLLASRLQHVYRALDRLRLQGLIEPYELEAEDGSVRDGVRATAKGARAFRAWQRDPIRTTNDAPLQVMIRFAATRPDDVATALYLLDCYERVVLALARGGRAGGGTLVEQALDEQRRVYLDSKLRWVAWVRDQLRKQVVQSDPR